MRVLMGVLNDWAKTNQNSAQMQFEYSLSLSMSLVRVSTVHPSICTLYLSRLSRESRQRIGGAALIFAWNSARMLSTLFRAVSGENRSKLDGQNKPTNPVYCQLCQLLLSVLKLWIYRFCFNWVLLGKAAHPLKNHLIGCVWWGFADFGNPWDR